MEERLTAFQQFLTDKIIEWEMGNRKQVSDNAFARYLGVSTGSWNQWKNGNRTPDFSNACKLARKLGPEVFDLLGFPRVIAANNPQLEFIVKVWDQLDTDTQNVIHEHVMEEVQKKHKLEPSPT